MRAAKTHGYAETLGGTDGDIGTQFRGRREQDERQRIGRQNRQASHGLHDLDGGAEIVNIAECTGILEQSAEVVTALQIVERVAGHNRPAERFGAGFDDSEGLRVDIAVNKEPC